MALTAMPAPLFALAQQVDKDSGATEFGTLWLRLCTSWAAPDGVLCQHSLRALHASCTLFYTGTNT